MIPILQFGTSRFLQAHVDLFVSEAGAGPIAVVQTTRSGDSRRRIEGFRTQRPYPVLLRGLVDGAVVDRRVEVGSVAAAWNSDEDWPAITQVACEATYFVSNTADRGWQLAADGPHDRIPQAFPAKLLTLLRARFHSGATPPTLLPCELISANGTTLRDIVLTLARDWGEEPAFVDWLHACLWVNALVDRIVSEALDPVGAVAEPYALWAIEAQPGFVPPCVHPDIRVVADLLPFERLKLFILNLGHTILAERWLETGTPETVADCMADAGMRRRLDDALNEVMPVFAGIGMADAAAAYRASVLDRFANPFLRHRLSDIATNHAAKKERRIGGLLALARQAGIAAPTPILSRCLGSGRA